MCQKINTTKNAAANASLQLVVSAARDFGAGLLNSIAALAHCTRDQFVSPTAPCICFPDRAFCPAPPREKLKEKRSNTLRCLGRLDSRWNSARFAFSLVVCVFAMPLIGGTAARAATVTPDQIDQSFGTTWTRAQYIQAVQQYYAVTQPDWSSYVQSLGQTANANRFATAGVKPCAALYRETGNTQYSDAVRANLLAYTLVAGGTTQITYSDMDYEYCYYQIYKSPSLSEADHAAIDKFLIARMSFLMQQEPDTSFCRGMFNSEALAYAAILLYPNNPNARQWLSVAKANVANNLQRLTDTTENSSNYNPFWYQALYEYAKVTSTVTGTSLAAFFAQPGIKNACERYLQSVTNVGYMPVYGIGGTYAASGQAVGWFEAMASLYNDGRYKAVAQRMFNFMRTAYSPTWCGGLSDICTIPVFDYASDNVKPVPIQRPSAGCWNRNLQGRSYSDKLVLCGGASASDPYVMLDFWPDGNHGRNSPSAIVDFIDEASPLIAGGGPNGDRVYHNLVMARGAGEDFPFVPAAAKQPGQQYITDNVRRHFALPIVGPAGGGNGANIIDSRYVSSMSLYVEKAVASGSSTVNIYIDHIQAVGPSGTVALLSGSLKLTDVFTPSVGGNWNPIAFSRVFNLTAYDTVEFWLRIEQTDTNGTITNVLPSLSSKSNGGTARYEKNQLDMLSMGQMNSTQAFAKMQCGSAQFDLKDTLGGSNIQRRDLMLAPGGFLLVRDSIAFPSAEKGVQIGPVWNAAKVPASGTNWYDLQQQPGGASLPVRNMLTFFPGRTDGDATFTTGTAQDSGSKTIVAYQKWAGDAAAGATRTFTTLLMGHDVASDPAAIAGTVQTLRCDETATVLQIGSNYLVINPRKAMLSAGALQTDAETLYLETSAGAVGYYAGTNGSRLIYSGSTVFSGGSRRARFDSAAPVLKVP